LPIFIHAAERRFLIRPAALEFMDKMNHRWIDARASAPPVKRINPDTSSPVLQGTVTFNRVNSFP
jgi:hypothetical protein